MRVVLVGVPNRLPAEVALHVPGAAMRTGMALLILSGAAMLCLVGLLDDRQHLGPWIKLGAQLVVAAAVVIGANLRILTMTGEPWSTTASG